jgi:phage-related protein
MDTIGPLAVEWLPLLVSAAVRLAEAFVPLYNVLLDLATVVLVPIIEAALPALLDALVQITNRVTQFAQQYLPELVAAMEASLPIFLALAELVGTTLVFAFEVVVSVINAVFTILSGLIDFLYGAFTGDWELAWSGIVEIFRGIFVDLIKGIMDAFWHWLVANFAEGLSAIWANVTEWFANLGAEFQRGLEVLSVLAMMIRDEVVLRFREMVDWVVAKISGFPEWLGAQLQRGEDLMMAVARSVRILLPGEMGEMVADAIEWVASFPRRALAALGDLSSTLVNAGRQLIGGLIEGIQSQFAVVESTLSSLTGMLPDWKGPASRDKKILFRPGRLVLDSFTNGLESRYARARTSLRRFTSEIAAATIPAPTISDVTARSSLALDQAQGGTEGRGTGAARVLNYDAAPQASIASEEALFAAASRSARMGW